MKKLWLILLGGFGILAIAGTSILALHQTLPKMLSFSGEPSPLPKLDIPNPAQCAAAMQKANSYLAGLGILSDKGGTQISKTAKLRDPVAKPFYAHTEKEIDLALRFNIEMERTYRFVVNINASDQKKLNDAGHGEVTMKPVQRNYFELPYGNLSDADIESIENTIMLTRCQNIGR
jgi:hypothetical protein